MRAHALLTAALLAALPGTGLAGDVLYFPKARVDAAFAQGAPLTENAHYKIHASRRDAPGVGEVHATDTDIIYMLEGSATLVTGGALLGSSEVAPNELRAPTIAGGTERTIAAGDVIVVPSGTPHWFKAVSAPVVYYVVKATDAGASR